MRLLGNPRVLGLAAATLLTVAAAAGCGGDDSADAPEPTATVTVTASASGSSDPSETVPTASAATARPTASSVTVPPGPDLSAPPTTYAEAVAHVKAATDVTDGGASELGSFTSPSGNIYCALNQPDSYAGCEIGEGKVDDPAACPGQQQTTSVGRIELQGDVAVAVCNTDTIVQPGAPVLAYGTAAYTRDTACVSEEVGVTCVSRGGPTGFFLAQGTYTLFNR